MSLISNKQMEIFDVVYASSLYSNVVWTYSIFTHKHKETIWNLKYLIGVCLNESLLGWFSMNFMHISNVEFGFSWFIYGKNGRTLRIIMKYNQYRFKCDFKMVLCF